MQCQVVKTLAVHCHCDICSAAVWHSSGCRKSWVCLQHHDTVVTSNAVTVYGSQFPSTVSKHCQHQHSAILKTIPAISNTNNPNCCDIQGAASWQHSSIATAISSLINLHTCKKTIKYNIIYYYDHSSSSSSSSSRRSSSVVVFVAVATAAATLHNLKIGSEEIK